MAPRQQRQTVASAPPPPARRVFARTGSAVTLGTSAYHVRVPTLAGAKEFHDWLDGHLSPQALGMGGGSTIGDILVSAVLSTASFGLLRELITRAIAEDLPDGAEQDADYEQLVTVVNVFFEDSGIHWLENLVKILAASMRRQMAGVMDAAAPSLLDQVASAVSTTPPASSPAGTASQSATPT